MKKLKQWYFNMVEKIPEIAFMEINKQIIASISAYLLFLVFAIFMKAWVFVLLFTVTFLLYTALLLYKMYLFKADKVVEIYGTCTLIDKDNFPYNRHFLLVATETIVYKVILTKKYNITVGSDVLVYATKNNILKMEAYTQVNNHLMLFITKIATKI